MILIVLIAEELAVWQEHEQMLCPVVWITTKRGSGSGTIVYSEDRGDGCQTYVLTNYHTIETAIRSATERSALLQTDGKREVTEEVKVEIFRYAYGRMKALTDAYQAEIVAYNKEYDLALLRLKTSRQVPYVAKLLPAGVEVYGFQRIYVVSCSLLNPPIAAKGELNDVDDGEDRKQYWRGTANIVFGNSGGAVFTRYKGNYCLIGVPIRIEFVPDEFLKHRVWFVPIPRVWEWVKEEHLLFLVDSSVKPTECFEKREKLRKEAERRLAAKSASEPTPAPRP